MNNDNNSLLIQYDNRTLLHELRYIQQAATQDSTTTSTSTQARYNDRVKHRQISCHDRH